MSSASKFLLHSSSIHRLLSPAAPCHGTRITAISSGVFPCWKPITPSTSPQCNAISGQRTGEHIDVIQNGLAGIKWQAIVDHDTEKDIHQETKSDKIRDLVETIGSMLSSMDDGEISVSAYDTAWVAMVWDVGGSGRPQFPSSLEWIANNQLSDGSWGDATTFSAHDRIINTLACVVALRSWNMHSDKSDKGICYIQENIIKLGDEDEEHMPIGFEVALPSLIEIAKKLGIDIPDDSPGMKEINARRDLKLARIPRDILHKVPTTLLHSLEGMGGLDWDELLKLQCADGSFLFSPSSSAFALHQTKDLKCLKYLNNQVQKFNGGVPNVYPVDLFEHLWAVDRVRRLGISRYFQPEIEECVDYVHRHWTNKGICWARNSVVQDIDDTAMAFRLLRLYGYEVSSDVFEHFEESGEFFCFAGQSTQAVTGMYNLYRASQVTFPRESILARARTFSSNFLQEKRANNELLDKWIITKDLPGEVGYALDVPWYANLSRVETRFYLEQYGGEDDVWIGKTLYRMSKVNNNTYLDLGRLDYNNCQAVHQQEWKSIKKWYRDSSLGEFGLSERSLILSYFIAAASIFEPENSVVRLAWAKTALLMETTVSHFSGRQFSEDQKRSFIDEFEYACGLKYVIGGRYKTRTSLVGTLLRTLNQLSLDTLLACGRDIHQQLYHAWQKWLRTLEEGGYTGTGDAELLVRTLNLSGGGGGRGSSGCISEELLMSHPKYKNLLEITSRVCHRLRSFQSRKDANGCVTDMGEITTDEIELDMQELVQSVLTKTSEDLDSDTKHNFLAIARSFYYVAYCNPGTINFHIAKVLFEGVM
ncbi:ent-copalyl diphosphate synthase 1-like [Primulina tabacum]|uniref:ent-copalyl diphosphate synthase 1-like n=1 Tax=Primulina tabacum TaxID=48773 RepID=UPI003F5AD3E8